MSGSESDQGGAGRREVAWRVFAAEYDDATLDHSESDEERAPNYVVTPTGARINRLFVVGVLTQVEQVSDDVLRARIVDSTGAFVVYAGQYQPDEMAFLENASPPAFVAVTGKARTFQPEDSDRVFTSIRPESINRVDADTRDRWVVQTAEQTLDRVSTFADALDSDARGDDLRAALEAGGADAGLAAGIPLAIDHYGTTKGYLADVWDLSIDAARVVAGEIDADDVRELDLAPDEGDDAVAVSLDYSLSDAEETEVAEVETSEGSAEPEPTEGVEAEPEAAAESETAPESETLAESEPTTDTETTPTDDAETTPTDDAETTPTDDAETTPTDDAETTPTDDLGEVPTSTVESETEAEAEVEDSADAAELQDEIGTDEQPAVEDEQGTSTDESFEPETDGQDDGPDIGTAGAGDEMYEFDEGEREQIEEEHGLEFSSGTEVGEPGEAGIETPEPETEPGAVESEPSEAVESQSSDSEAVEPASPDSEAAESEAEPEAEDEGGEKEEPEDLENAVMETMADLNEGDGVERETLLAAVVQQYDVTPADVEDALESALMAGRCYESGEDTLKPI